MTNRCCSTLTPQLSWSTCSCAYIHVATAPGAQQEPLPRDLLAFLRTDMCVWHPLMDNYTRSAAGADCATAVLGELDTRSKYDHSGTSAYLFAPLSHETYCNHAIPRLGCKCGCRL